MESGAPGGAWEWGTENSQGPVHGSTGSERARAPVCKPHSSTHGPGQDNGCLCPISWMQRAGPGTSWLPSSRASHRPLPGTMRARQPHLPGAAPAQGNFKRPQPGTRALPGPGGGDWGALTTVLLRWLWTVKSGQKSRSATARSRDSARGRAFSSSSSPCLGHSAYRPPQS